MAMPPNLLLRIRRIASGVPPDKTRITNHFLLIPVFFCPPYQACPERLPRAKPRGSRGSGRGRPVPSEVEGRPEGVYSGRPARLPGQGDVALATARGAGGLGRLSPHPPRPVDPGNAVVYFDISEAKDFNYFRNYNSLQFGKYFLSA